MLCVLMVFDTQLKSIIIFALSWIKSAIAQLAPYRRHSMTALSFVNVKSQVEM